MGELVKIDSHDLMTWIHGQGNEVGMPKPFARDIFLFDTYIAGTSHVPNMASLVEGLNLGDRLDLFREPNNPYDNLAIVVKTKNKEKLGFIPQRVNPVFARLLDAGKEVFAKVVDIEDQGGWVEIDIALFLHD